MEASEDRVLQDGKNQKGQTVASGIYFYRLEAADYVSVKRMGMVKQFLIYLLLSTEGQFDSWPSFF